ncbi:hypothetical protein GOBAR_AA26217 [Gossypium barbadense]|uniref:Uncharacterized protein n=1 Tax=Gossypium barbadense TaxID=3634 RepID=A0A2P5WTN1_GOSBA|nr:hypothetical protein GOBAR_AA26217 [Gossypium barbadense]
MEIERFFLQMSGGSFIQEHGFYDYLKYRENCKQKGERITYGIIRGKEVLVTPQDICWYYNAPYYTHGHLETLDLFTFEDFDMEGIIVYLTVRHGEWTHQVDFEVPLKLNTTIMFRMTNMWMQFIFTRLAPTYNAFFITAYQMATRFIRRCSSADDTESKNGWPTPTPFPDMFGSTSLLGEEGPDDDEDKEE